MKVFVPLAASGIAIALAAPSTFRGPRMLTNSVYSMTPVHAIHARVQGNKPAWDTTVNAFIPTYGSTFDAKYRGGLDTVNTASVEGALMYVQAEGIDNRTQSTPCVRKNNMQYVVFYNITIAQPEAAVAQFKSEYGPYSAMDGGQCTPTNGTTVFSQACNWFNGTNGEVKLGAYVGEGDHSTDPRAPYPNTTWFSFPNSCPQQLWASKTDACRASTMTGSCAFNNTMPDGITCSYSYRILGWIPIDDLVGITATPTTADATKTYTNFTTFCNDGNIEFKTNTDGTYNTSIAFWKNPTDTTANAARAAKLVKMYNDAVAAGKPGLLTQVTTDEITHFTAIPTVASLTASNPPCYQNDPNCASATNGCKRDLYSQLCTVCTAAADGCVTAPSNFTFPTLVQATLPPSPSGTNTSSGGSTTTPSTTPSTTKSAASSLTLSVVSVASVAMSIALSCLLA